MIREMEEGLQQQRKTENHLMKDQSSLAQYLLEIQSTNENKFYIYI